MAQSAWTRPAVTSILTGLDPHRHGVQERLDRLPESFDTLPEMLQREGYQTAAFVSSAVITAKLGFGQGFRSGATWRQPSRKRSAVWRGFWSSGCEAERRRLLLGCPWIPSSKRSSGALGYLR